MNHIKLILCVDVLAILYLVTGIKVNMQGSLSFGRDVVESLSHYFGNNILSGRRFFNPPPIEDPITAAVRTALTCKDLEFCQDKFQHFVDEYVIILAKAVLSILINSEPSINNQYEEQLKYILADIRKILENADANIKEESEMYYWMHVIKKICAKFHHVGEIIKHDTSNGFNNNTVQADLRHKIIIATAFIERKYLIKLCSEYGLCSKSNECTRALNKILIHFKTMPEDRIRLFVKFFYKALFDSAFYSHLSQATANEFQIILNDMIYSNNTPAKDIMLSVQKSVEARMEMLKTNKGLEVAHEILLAHVILSDVDHMFNNHTDAFTMFINKFYDWLASDIQLEKHMRSVISDISKQISSFDEDLMRKLIDELNVFLEMTVNASEK